MSFDASGFEQLRRQVADFDNKHQQFLRQFLTEMGMRALAQTKSLTPVDTGDLRLRWELSAVMRVGNTLQIVIFNPLVYASHIEDGHMQDARFLPLSKLEERSVKGKRLARQLRRKYGRDAKGIMLKRKWIPGVHMARISIDKIERELPARYNRAFQRFIANLGG